MNQYTYDHEIMTMSTMFMNAFSDIVIKRFNVHKQARDRIKTRVVYAPKQRVLNDLLDKDQNLKLPVISCYIGGINRDQGRVFNKLMGTFHTPTNSSTSNREKGPLPIDVTYNVSIMTRYQQDMDQILSHLLPYVNPYFTVSWRTPNRPEFEIRSNVFWNGNVNIQYPFDVAATQVARVVADLSFVFKGWLFQNQEEVQNIHSFTSSIYPNALSDYLLDTDISFSENDAFELQFQTPKPTVVEPHFARVGSFQQFNVWGSNFKKITNVYLSGAPLGSLTTTQTPFSSVPELSSVYPGFTAFKLASAQWKFDGDTLITFVMPSASNTGYLDLIVEGPAGYGKLTESVKVSTFNPFLSTQPEYFTFVPYQLPFLSGIKIGAE